MLGTEDHGIMTCYLYLDYGGSGQGFGGYSFDTPKRDGEGKFLGRKGTAWGMTFVMKVLQTLEIPSWEKLPGTHCRVKASWGKVSAIGHIIKDQWFNPEEDLEKVRPCE